MLYMCAFFKILNPMPNTQDLMNLPMLYSAYIHNTTIMLIIAVIKIQVYRFLSKSKTSILSDGLIIFFSDNMHKINKII